VVSTQVHGEYSVEAGLADPVVTVNGDVSRSLRDRVSKVVQFAITSNEERGAFIVRAYRQRVVGILAEADIGPAEQGVWLG
jgi:hypothetical protein